MKLGGMLGLTAPMAILCDFTTEELQYVYSILNYSVNRINLESFRKELLFLKKSLEQIPVTYSLSEESQAFTKNSANVTLINGVLSNEDLRYALVDEISGQIILKIVKSVKSNRCKYNYMKMFSCSDVTEDISRLTKIIEDYLSTCNVTSIITARVATSILSKYREEVECPDEMVSYLCSLGDVRQSFADSFMIGDEKMTLSEDEYKLLSFFIENRSKIDDLLSLFVVKTNEDIQVFGLPFSTLIGRSPVSLLYKVVERFDYAKNKNSNVLLTIIKGVQVDLDLLKDLFEKRVVVKQGDIRNALSSEEFQRFVTTLVGDKREFFVSLFDSDILKPQEITLDILEHLSSFYDQLDRLAVEMLNLRIGTNFTEDSFAVMVKKFNHIGICGLNTASHYLFGECIGNVSLVTINNYPKSEQEYAEYQQSIDNVQCLLDTLIPLGGEI